MENLLGLVALLLSFFSAFQVVLPESSESGR